jgi:hypothetical protein
LGGRQEQKLFKKGFAGKPVDPVAGYYLKPLIFNFITGEPANGQTVKPLNKVKENNQNGGKLCRRKM